MPKTPNTADLSRVDINDRVAALRFPGLVTAIGPFNEYDDITFPSQDYEEALKMIPGTIVGTQDALILILAAEMYLRDAHEDIYYAETTVESFPERSYITQQKRQYSNKDVKVMITTEADGGGAIDKLIYLNFNRLIFW